ncbi:hypothetical protein PanWU01x14_251630 [Parasponia andersonii]|uniref:Uncharacterized protein n=1 Tax=Parasponia andersonii TaxID=3476 RepID=A0A2P5BC84_PARAD|nr:hypothetical protein PanWU01x14_251630 [Parasponia andersonii]
MSNSLTGGTNHILVYPFSSTHFHSMLDLTRRLLTHLRPIRHLSCHTQRALFPPTTAPPPLPGSFFPTIGPSRSPSHRRPNRQLGLRYRARHASCVTFTILRLRKRLYPISYSAGLEDRVADRDYAVNGRAPQSTHSLPPISIPCSTSPAVYSLTCGLFVILVVTPSELSFLQQQPLLLYPAPSFQPLVLLAPQVTDDPTGNWVFAIVRAMRHA